jgi:SAM-dependent methyltransferase
MENQIANTQPEQYLDLLLEYLARPTDRSISLTAVRSPDGKIVALKSDDREYPVVNNVPCMIPHLGESRSSSLTLWQELQNTVWQDYQSGRDDIFSGEGDPMGRGVGQVINQRLLDPLTQNSPNSRLTHLPGDALFLDVGCGVLPLPSYMAVSSDHVSWIGIDPFFGEVARQFPFAQALGEYLPFRPQVFDGVLYAGTIIYQIDPWRSLECTRDIIKPQGKLFIWYDPERVDSRYIAWKTMRTLGFARRYTKNHQWAFTHRSLRTLLRSTGFALVEVIPLCERFCPDYPTCNEPTVVLAVARCV